MRSYKKTILSIVSLAVLFSVIFYLHPLPLMISKQKKSFLLDEAELMNNERIKQVKRVCRAYNLGHYKTNAKLSMIKHPPSPQYSVFYFDKKNKLAYCPLYKAASTTWLFNFCLLFGYTEEQLRNSKEQLSTLARRVYPEIEFPEAQEALEESLKILVVRHPFERLLSAYRDKLENVNINKEHGSEHFYKKYSGKIVKKYRTNSTINSRQLLHPGTFYWDPNKPEPSGKEPTFREFVRYLIDVDLMNYSDDHWIPYYLYCTPCMVKYDFIGKVETLDKDQVLAIEKAHLSDRIFPRWQHRSSELPGLSRLYFRQLTRKEIRDLFKKYRLDFELFGYSINPYFQYARS